MCGVQATRDVTLGIVGRACLHLAQRPALVRRRSAGQLARLVIVPIVDAQAGKGVARRHREQRACASDQRILRYGAMPLIGAVASWDAAGRSSQRSASDTNSMLAFARSVAAAAPSRPLVKG